LLGLAFADQEDQCAGMDVSKQGDVETQVSSRKEANNPQEKNYWGNCFPGKTPLPKTLLSLH
jgi:hypothetical protein